MLELAAFTGTKTNPSSRFRIRQHITDLHRHQVNVHDFSTYFNTFAPKSKLIRPVWAVANLIEHFFQVQASHGYDIAFIQREMLATFYTNERFIKIPAVLDVDDAIFLLRNGTAARKLASKADHLICGNNFLANWFENYNENISIIPTGIDTARFIPLEKRASSENKIIGWSGSSSGFKFLYNIESALKTVLDMFPDARLRIVADRKPGFLSIDPLRVDFQVWQESLEVSQIQDMTVGIMPLNADDWSRGKCSFKMLAYMACGVPVVVSPVGMNREVLDMGMAGLGAESIDEWVEALRYFLTDGLAAEKSGSIGRAIVEERFSLNVISAALANVFNKVI